MILILCRLIMPSIDSLITISFHIYMNMCMNFPVFFYRSNKEVQTFLTALLSVRCRFDSLGAKCDMKWPFIFFSSPSRCRAWHTEPVTSEEMRPPRRNVKIGWKNASKTGGHVCVSHKKWTHSSSRPAARLSRQHLVCFSRSSLQNAHRLSN